jgi:hypothetical protein
VRGCALPGIPADENPAKTPGTIRGKIGSGSQNKTIRNGPGIIHPPQDNRQTIGFSRLLCCPLNNLHANGKSRIGRSIMKTNMGIFTGLLVLGLLCLCGMAAAQQDVSGPDTSGTVLTDDIQPYDGPIGADSPLYALKIALEDIDESFTANETERVDKQMDHARLRLSEVRRSLELNQSESAEQALNNYWLKMNLTNMTISRWGSNATGLLHAQEMIVKHQFVLEHLLETLPNNTGLRRAYNNSLRLEEKFGEKTAIRFNRTMEKNNQTILKAIRLEQKEHDRKGWQDANLTANATMTQPDDHQKGWEKNKDKNEGDDNPLTTVATKTPGNQQQGQGHQQDDNGKGNADDKGKSNSRNK